MLIRSVNALEKRQAQRKHTLVANKLIDSLSTISLPFTNEDGRKSHIVCYIPRDGLASRQRLGQSISRPSTRTSTPPLGAAQALALSPLFFPLLDGFDAWMIQAAPIGAWPFSIQPDGPRLDLLTAICVVRLVGDAQQLTLPDFGSRLAQAASASYARNDALEIGIDLPSLAEPLDPCDRWRPLGGPM